MATIKLFHKHFTLIRNLVDSEGDSVWNVIPNNNSNSAQFVIHVRKGNQIYVSFFRHKYKSDATAVDLNLVSEALHLLCEYLVSEGGSNPSIDIKPPNDYLFTAALRAGMRHCKPRRSVLVYKKK